MDGVTVKPEAEQVAGGQKDQVLGLESSTPAVESPGDIVDGVSSTNMEEHQVQNNVGDESVMHLSANK